MGKEWYWVGKSSKRHVIVEGVETTTTTTPSGCMCAFFHFFDFHPFNFSNTLNQQQQEITFKSKDNTSTTVTKGTEAPRNSLESEDGKVSASLSKEENFKIPKNIKIKTKRSNGGNLTDLSSEIINSPGTKTPTLVARLMGLDLLPSENSPSFSSSLPTPNPHLNQVRTKQQHIQTKHRNSIDSSDIASTRSLPETPRISSSRKSDVDRHRFSLQINKENSTMMMNLDKDLDLPRFSFSKKKIDDNSCKSPNDYARQIVKQVKESVGRKVGQDITNSLRSYETLAETRTMDARPIRSVSATELKSKQQHEKVKESVGRKVDQDITNTLKSYDALTQTLDTHLNISVRDTKAKSKKGNEKEEFVGQFIIKKCPKTSLKDSNSSCSPKIKFMDNYKPNTRTTTTTSKDQNTHSNVLKPLPKTLHALKEEQQESRDKKLVSKCKKASNDEKFSSRFKRPPQTSNPKVNEIKSTTKSKKTQPLASNFLNNINAVPNLVHASTEPSPLAIKIPQKQSQVSETQDFKLYSQLSSCSSQMYKQEETITNVIENKFNGSFTIGTHKPEFHYITQILNKQGTTKIMSFDKWFSPTHPLDPSIFNHLEHNSNDKDQNFARKDQLGHRWNRKLMFDLVDEILMEILKHKGSEKSLCFLGGFCDEWTIIKLTERVLKRVREFPCAKCDVLDDIDNLIEAEDMEKLIKVEDEEERDEVVIEIEENLLDTLLHETIMILCGSESLF